jgi:hypothetical protein
MAAGAVGGQVAFVDSRGGVLLSSWRAAAQQLAWRMAPAGHSSRIAGLVRTPCMLHATCTARVVASPTNTDCAQCRLPGVLRASVPPAASTACLWCCRLYCLALPLRCTPPLVQQSPVGAQLPPPERPLMNGCSDRTGGGVGAVQ